MHFQSAWLLLLTGVAYVVAGILSRHFQRNLVPAAGDRTWQALRTTVRDHLRFDPAVLGESSSYNALQRLSYLGIVFVLVPLIIWTGLAMSPAFTSVVPWSVTLLGGRQSARTIHLFSTGALVLFSVVHVLMIILAGFRARVRPMITGAAETAQ